MSTRLILEPQPTRNCRLNHSPPTFTYLLHPGTAIYVGYNSGLNNLAMDQTNPTPTVFYQGSPTDRNNQLAFVKVSYLLRL